MKLVLVQLVLSTVGFPEKVANTQLFFTKVSKVHEGM